MTYAAFLLLCINKFMSTFNKGLRTFQFNITIITFVFYVYTYKYIYKSLDTIKNNVIISLKDWLKNSTKTTTKSTIIIV